MAIPFLFKPSPQTPNTPSELAANTWFDWSMSTVRKRFQERANELADCASLTVESDEVAEWLRIVPHNHRAVGVYLYRLLASESPAEIRHSHPGAIPLEEPTNASDVDHMVDLAVEGRLQIYALSPSSAVIEELRDGIYKRAGTNGFPAILRLPGWRRRAQLISFEPYRSPGAA